ncbi:AMP-binding protein [Herbiconiux sp. KACC 21604]|uniref:AMP-binding protein n=1 Tax=unclassified Herbiconiux TaxID=2618217 RepID=UPI0014922883|nr:AMP-binding protein [Herbiconiux sp. SALV-R1]QJU52238.1 AMP-binding protein [Herbiconiux sp. SALV-R1]WPO87083.1 AMP-binding protein [Herbiconiux sp. KACC 21604]
MRPLALLDAGQIELVERALRDSLSHSGPAVLVREHGRSPSTEASTGSVRSAGSERSAQGAGPVLPSDVPTKVALVVETSGSSGAPKRVMLSGEALLASAAATESALGGPGQWLLALPVHYIAGIQVLVRSIAAGTEPLHEPPGPYWAERFAALVAGMDAPRRYTSLVPTQLARLVEAAHAESEVRRAVARLDAVLVGGQALPEPLRQRALDLGIPVVRTYGSSETAGGCVYDGVPIGSTVVRERHGEIEITGPSLAEGYLGDPELTAERFVDDGGVRWYRTSDGGSVGADGRLAITGRLDNVIISGGVKVSLDLVERLVQSQPGFQQAVVVGADDETWGQVAVVVTDREPSPTALATLRAAVVPVAGRASAPAAVHRVDTLPLLPSGKPDRLALAQSLPATAH